MGCGGDSEEYKSAMQRAANAYQFFLQKQSQDPVFMRMQEPKFIREHYMLARM